MLKLLMTCILLISTTPSSMLLADCCRSVDVSLGWRRDDLKWRIRPTHFTSDISPRSSSSSSSRFCSSSSSRSSSNPRIYMGSNSNVPVKVRSRTHFKNVNSYTISGKARWTDSDYYIRLSAEYGQTYKGKALERFHIRSPLLLCPIAVTPSDRVKRHGESYDFNIAAGYPLTFCCSRLLVVPLIGFSYHRQRLLTKHLKEESFYCCHSSCRSSSSSHCHSCHKDRLNRLNAIVRGNDEELRQDPSSSSRCDLFDFSHCCHDSSRFRVSSDNPFVRYPSSNPFGSRSSNRGIASILGLSNPHRLSKFRFTWYGFYVGTDIAYALDPSWTLFSELEFHFLDHTHRRRKSWTGVHFVDRYHRRGWSYGFNSIVGFIYAFSTCWYSTITVDFRWWRSDASHDRLRWQMAGVKAGLGYSF